MCVCPCPCVRACVHVYKGKSVHAGISVCRKESACVCVRWECTSKFERISESVFVCVCMKVSVWGEGRSVFVCVLTYSHDDYIMCTVGYRVPMSRYMCMY